MNVKFKPFLDAKTMAKTVADAIASRLKKNIRKNGTAGLIVPGGRSPQKLFYELAQQKLNWEKVIIGLTDERWVDPFRQSSNELLVKQSLLTQYAASAKFIGLKTPHKTPEEGETDCIKRLAVIPSPVDIVILGMGMDGHTASLFPNSDELITALDPENTRPCQALNPNQLPEDAPYPRMTLTLSRILDSRWIVLLLEGKAKLEVYEKALSGRNEQEMPIRAILQQKQTPVMVFWAP